MRDSIIFVQSTHGIRRTNEDHENQHEPISIENNCEYGSMNVEEPATETTEGLRSRVSSRFSRKNKNIQMTEVKEAGDIWKEQSLPFLIQQKPQMPESVDSCVSFIGIAPCSTNMPIIIG